MKTFEFFAKNGQRLVGAGRGVFQAFQAAVRDNVFYGDGNAYSYDRDIRSVRQVC
jgi:hypothetical protein